MTTNLSKLKKHLDAVLANHTQTKDHPIETMNDNSVITLIGTVPSREVKERAEMLVKKQAGVSAVINELHIKQTESDQDESLIVPAGMPSKTPISNQA